MNRGLKISSSTQSMRVFKFGGASVKDAESVKNVVSILKEFGHKETLVVVSAMGKTTNAMEEVVAHYFDDDADENKAIRVVEDFHYEIIDALFESKSHPIYKKLQALFEEVKGFLAWNKSPNYSFVYDQVVGYGELVSTTILSYYMNEIGIANEWLDVRTCIKTGSEYRDAKVDWDLTAQAIKSQIDISKLYVTQGFLGSDENNFTTTLGREGSDYSAAILAYCLDASSVTIWKDVPGVLNADPRYFEDAELLNSISYREAIELAFYGASVIHPKTLQPLQRKEIPLRVKSFVKPNEVGTVVGKGKGIEPKVPCFIVKKDQVLIKLSSLDFSFIVEDSMSELFNLFHKYQTKVELIQNSAISFSVCVDNKFKKLDELLLILKNKYKISVHRDVSLYTIRHFDQDAINKLQNGKDVLLEQRGKETLQLVVA